MNLLMCFLLWIRFGILAEIKKKHKEMLNNRYKFLSIKKLNLSSHKPFIITFFLFGLSLVVITARHPIGDFGNYYYGSKFFFEGIDPIKFYKDIHFFNSEIRKYESGAFFENYTPVPPFSLLAYLPFLLFKSAVAKIIFNLCGLFLLTGSFLRLLQTLNFFSNWLYALPIIFFQPLYSNFHQGQSYLIICALLIEFYLLYQRKASWQIGLIIAILFSLKIFPAFAVALLIFRKDLKSLAWSLFLILSLQLVTSLFVGIETIKYYYLEVLPRLAANEVTEPFSYFNQSLHAFLINLFVFHPYLNPRPLFNAPILAAGIQAIVYSLIFSIFIKTISTRTVYESFAILIFALILINQYCPVYSLIILLPTVFLFKNMKVNKRIFILMILLMACNLPVYKLGALHLALQYARVWLLITLFVLLTVSFDLKPAAKSVLSLTLLFILLSLIYQKKSSKQSINLSGNDVVYDFKVTNEHIILLTCLGHKDTTRFIRFVINKIAQVNISNNGNDALSKGKYMYQSTGNIYKSCIINDTSLLLLTDENRGVGMNRLIHFTLK